MLKKLQKIGIKFNYLKLRYLTLFSFFFQSKIDWEKRKNSEIQKICFKSILFIIKCSPPKCDTTSCPFNHCIKCLFNHIPIQVQVLFLLHLKLSHIMGVFVSWYIPIFCLTCPQKKKSQTVKSWDRGGEGQSPFFSRTWHFDKIKNTYTAQIKYQEFEQKKCNFSS